MPFGYNEGDLNRTKKFFIRVSNKEVARKLSDTFLSVMNASFPDLIILKKIMARFGSMSDSVTFTCSTHSFEQVYHATKTSRI
jgi:hypothetical protein